MQLLTKTILLGIGGGVRYSAGMASHRPRSLPCGVCRSPVFLGKAEPGAKIPCASCGKVLMLGRKKSSSSKPRPLRSPSKPRPSSESASPKPSEDLTGLGRGPVDFSALARTPTKIDGNRAEEGLVSPIASYLLEKELGRGGMATVYKATQKSLGRVVALKIMAERFSKNPDLVRRFEQEARALAALAHPNIVFVYDQGRTSNLFYFAMEYVAGRTLSEEIKKRGSGLPIPRAIGIMAQVASALAYTHKNGTIHRDIKPCNILITSEDLVKVTDFGLAHVFRPGTIGRAARTVVGTPKYMAPEQSLGEPVDHRADIFSFGLTFHELITGELPGYSGRTLKEILPALDPRIEWLIARCLETKRENRFQSAFHIQEMLADIALEIAESAGADSNSKAGTAPEDLVSAPALMGEPLLNRGLSPKEVPAPVLSPSLPRMKESAAADLLQGLLNGLVEPATASEIEQMRLAQQETVAPPPEVQAQTRIRVPKPQPEVLAAADLAEIDPGLPPPAVQAVDVAAILKRAKQAKAKKGSSFGKPVGRSPLD